MLRSLVLVRFNYTEHEVLALMLVHLFLWRCFSVPCRFVVRKAGGFVVFMLWLCAALFLNEFPESFGTL